MNIASRKRFVPSNLARKWSADGDNIEILHHFGATNERLEKRMFLDMKPAHVSACLGWGVSKGETTGKTRFGIRKEWRSVGIFSAEENSENTVLAHARSRGLARCLTLLLLYNWYSLAVVMGRHSSYRYTARYQCAEIHNYNSKSKTAVVFVRSTVTH